MAETKKFVDLHGLDVFWDGAKKYIDAADEVVTSHADGLNTAMDARVAKLEGINHEAYKAADAALKEELLAKIAENAAADALLQTAVDTNTGNIKSIQDELESLSGGAGSIATQINNAITALDLPNTYEAKGEAAQALVDAKAYTDGKVDGKFDAAGSAATAEQNAKDYADGLASNYDAAGAAAQALVDAKAYTDGKVDGKFDAAGSAATVQDNLDVHTGDTVAHITADERTAWNTAKASIDAFLKDADMTADAVDTLKELQTYMTTDGAAAAELVGRVGALETADETIRGEFATADAQVLADAKADATTKADAAKADAIAAAATDATTKADAALAAAKADAAALYQVKGSYEAAGAAAAALDAAKADATTKANAAQAAAEATAAADATTKANAALTDAKAYADGLATNYDAAGAASAAETAAKKYTDDTIAAFEFASEGDINALFA